MHFKNVIFFKKNVPSKNKLKKISCLKFKKLLIFQEELPKPEKLKFILFFQKNLRINFSKTLSDNNFHILYKLNQMTLLVFKNIENHQFFFSF